MDFSKLSREDLMVLIGGIVLAIGLLAFPWISVSFGPITATSAGTGAPDGIFGVLALIVVVLVVIDLALERYSPQTEIPTTPLGRAMTRVAAMGLAILFLLIKFLDHTGNLGWGFFVDIVLVAVVTYGAWAIAQGKSTSVQKA